MTSKGPGLYDFLIEAELQQYFSAFKKDLKVHNVGQLKFVTDDDLLLLGMSRPEIRRLKKYFQKHYPQTYISKFKKILLQRKDSSENGVLLLEDVSDRDRSVFKVPNKHIIPAESIVINKELGVGEFGVVQQGVWTNEEGERVQVAIKCLSKERMQSQPMEFLKEAAIMHHIESEHIVRLFGVVLDTNALMLVTELAPLRSLLECLKESSLRENFPVTSLCDFAVQICDGMCYLEAKRLIHRDLAARNILVFSKNKVKISDFGLSRALGVGKDYYRTNFNVNLKLPIAWCAPECINYLRFTTASDVWAYGVTLWEVFSYGFQPWAALTGQQILETIDEPNSQRLEQPDLCPKEYYAVMRRCWQHDPLNRPKFVDLMTVLPDLKPEQVQAVKDACGADVDGFGALKETLHYGQNDVITVLDKRPVMDVAGLWKGVLRSGKSGLFNPTNTVAYLGSSVPSTKSAFQRGDGKNGNSSKRRLRPDMISAPRGDLKHTGHVGLDGAYFGDVSSFMEPKIPASATTLVSQAHGEKVTNGWSRTLKSQKHKSDEISSTTLTRASSDVSERAPLLKKVGDRGKFGPASERHWSDSTCEECIDSPSWLKTECDLPPWEQEVNGGSVPADAKLNLSYDHEYHEISDEEKDFHLVKKENIEGEAGFQNDSFDLGPSLMDEVFKALGGGSSNGEGETPPSTQPPLPPLSSLPGGGAAFSDDESHNVKNEIKEITSRLTSRKKASSAVRAISAKDELTLDSAIAMANEIASKSMLRLDGSLETLDGPMDGATTRTDGGNFLSSEPSSPVKPVSKFSFKFPSRSSPKQERRHFSEEAASIPDIQSSITEEAKHCYNDLVERKNSCPDSKEFDLGTGLDSGLDNPLRLLRQGMTVRPKIRGNKFGGTVERSVTNKDDFTANKTLPKGFKSKKTNPPPVKPRPLAGSFTKTNGLNHDDAISLDSDSSSSNPIPLPPRDRTKSTHASNKRHQRRYPLIIPDAVANTLRKASLSEPKSDSVSPSKLVIQHTHNPLLGASSSKGPTSNPAEEPPDSPSRMPPAKPPRLFSSLDDSFESHLEGEMDALDEVGEDLTDFPSLGLGVHGFFSGQDDVLGGMGSQRSLLQSADHVSCEDLLDFALDKPNSRRTQGPSHGVQSDEVNLLIKVLKFEVTSLECVESLDVAGWDIHRALKILRLRLLCDESAPTPSEAKSALQSFGWDVSNAASYFLASRLDDDSAQV